MMIKEIQLPEISENVDSGDVIKVLVKVGDFIQKDQPIVELETEKATFEVPSPLAGKITEVPIKEGGRVKVGQLLVRIDTEAKEDAPQTTEQKPEVTTSEKVEQKKEEKPQEHIKIPAEEAKEEETPAEKSQPPSPIVSSNAPAAPSVRQLARELGLEISQIPGTGPGGRISAEDVKNYAKNRISRQSIPTLTASIPKALPDFARWGTIEREKISVTRKKIIENLRFTWSTVPQVTQFDQADITDLEKFRTLYAKTVEEQDGKLTITAILLKVLAKALFEFPIFNTSYDPDAEEIVYKKYCHISVAVDTDRGLLVPVIRDVDKKNILQLALELNQLAQKARDHKVTPDDMVGGNFTISNLGGIGGTHFAPILNWPQVAILGVGRASSQPVYIEAVLQRRLILPLSLSYDHRIIDGAGGIRFLRWVVQYLENPFRIALEETNS